MEIIFKGRQTDVPDRFREHATTKLNKIEKLDTKAIRVDVEVSVERNPRQASQKERVELTIRSRGPAIRAEAAAEDRFAALDLAIAKLDSRLRRALDRRKGRYGAHGPYPIEAEPTLPTGAELPQQPAAPPLEGDSEARTADASMPANVVSIEMEGSGPLVVRQKLHRSDPISLDQALLEMELVGHDFYLYHDIDENLPSVVYRRRGYQYGVIRLVENSAGQNPTGASGAASGVGRKGRSDSSRSDKREPAGAAGSIGRMRQR